VPFDLESTWSAALVLLIAPIIDPSLLGDHDESLQTVLDVLNDMASVGNSVAAGRQKELDQLSKTLEALQIMEPSQQESARDSLTINTPVTLQQWDLSHMVNTEPYQSEVDYTSTHSFDMEEVLTTEQLEAVANAMNLNDLDWTWAVESIDQLDASLL